jgi:phage tail-like protein
MPDFPPGQVLRFQVEIDDEHDLGTWSKCDGLSVEFELKEYQEGGVNGYTHKLPGRAKYQNIKLTRVLNKESDKVKKWLTDLKTSGNRPTAEITAMDSEGQTITSWTLQQVYPLKWTGPSFDVGSNATATETLELAHNGFLKG